MESQSNMECIMEWNPENTLELIMLIRERPVIWDAISNENKNKTKKADAFAEVAEIMGISVNSVITKWLSLRSQFNREKKKVTNVKTGSGADKIYKSKWFAYEEMASLMSCNIPQNSITNFEIAVTPPPSTPAPSVSPDMPIPSPTLSMPSPPSLQHTLPPTTPAPEPKRNRNTGIYKEALTTLKAIRERKRNCSVDDEISTFATYIAAQMRKLQPILQSKLKLDIQTLLCKYEIENIEYGRPGTSMSYNTDFYSDAGRSTFRSYNIHPDIQDIQSPSTSSRYNINQDIQATQPPLNSPTSTQASTSSVSNIQPDTRAQPDITASTSNAQKKIISISKDGTCTETLESQFLDNSVDQQPRVILDRTIVRPAATRTQTDDTQASTSSVSNIQPDTRAQPDITASTSNAQKKIILISKDGTCTETLESQFLDNSVDQQPRVLILDRTIVRPAATRTQTDDTQASTSSVSNIQPDTRAQPDITASTSNAQKKIILISKDGTCTKTLGSQFLDNSVDQQPRVLILDRTIVRPAATRTQTDEDTKKEETMKALEDLLKFK